MTNDYSNDYLAALELAEQAMPVDPRARGLGVDDLAETVGTVSDEDGNPVGGTSKMRRVKGDDDWENTTVLYSTLDGSPSTVLRGMVTKKLQQRWPEVNQVPEVLWGKPVFTRKPLLTYKMGENLCFLNPKHKERDFIVAIGLGSITCRKSNLPTEFAARQHGEHKHSAEWASYVEAKALRDREQSEYRTIEQSQIMQQLLQTLVEQNAANKEVKKDEPKNG